MPKKNKKNTHAANAVWGPVEVLEGVGRIGFSSPGTRGCCSF